MNHDQQASLVPDLILPWPLTLEDMYLGSSKTRSFVKQVLVRGRSFQIADQVTVTTPQGINNGDTIILPGKGNIFSAANRPEAVGRLIIVVRQIPHAYLQRNGNHLETTITLSLLESLLGKFSASIVMPDQRTLRITYNEGNVIQPGDTHT